MLHFKSSIWLDTSYNGELLALSGAAYLQGSDEEWDGDTRGLGNDTLGQAAIVTFQVAFDAEPITPPELPSPLLPWEEWGKVRVLLQLDALLVA